ncbi:FG-GAP-like repeat-containing protein [Roseibium sediminicola]|uniref:FG-GAP-like repeat-containing protein n=1 Tax=Roseibium sediminicola TaxID=2933272 RepID=A0ABT0H091_9HYPH|nr:FG-GAP-like repeat-containing protein [Roseibium sp. CAU 1639]MCK7615113.1 FG-GAP-like repeat-containing protein [Roseibium sp. CAU 1639]
MAFDGLGALEAREVVDLIVHDDQQVLNIDGIHATPNHPFLLPDGSFKPIGDLSVGDMIVRADGASHVIENISQAEGLHTVYNFTVAGLHTYVAAGFRVHNKFAAPVMLDLDGDGLEVTALDRSTVFLDTGGDGFLHRTAWAGEGDGVLYFDPDGREEITEKRQFVFTEWDPTATSDLEALASVFDSNGDGVLNASDTDFAKFKVMVTLADGSTVSKTLAELGITEIDLTADATNIELSDGSVITGKTTFTRADGTTGTVGDMLLAAEKQGHRVTQEESVDGSGTRSLTTTAYAADGSKAYEFFSEVSADGLSVTNRYDDDGDGVIDRIQTIETVVNDDNSRTETEQNYSGSDLATAVLTSREITTKSADHLVETIERDSMGGGWVDQRETRTEAADGSLTIEVVNLAQDERVITSTSETVSLDGSERIDGLDADGDTKADTIETHLVDKHDDDSRTETVTVTNQDGSLRSKTIEEVEADNRSKVITRDLDGDGQIDQREILDITVTPAGGSTSRLEIRNGDGSLKSASTTVTSDDALTKTTKLDRDGDGDIDLTTVDATTVNADGSRERIVTERNGDNSIRSMRKESLDADKVGQEVFADLDRNGSFEADEKVSSVVVDTTTQERTATQWTRSDDGSVLAKVTSVTSADGLTRDTTSDLDGDGDIDLKVSDVTVQNADGSSTRTVTTKNGDNSLRTIVETTTSADGLTKTVREDVDGDGVFEKKSVNTLVLEADGGTTRTASAYAGDETTLLSETVTTESADRRTRTVTADRDGDGKIDSTSVREKGTDGAVTLTVTETGYDGTGSEVVLGKTVTTTSANGLDITKETDLDGDQVTDVTRHSTTTLNADGSRTTVSATKNGDGSLRSTSTVTVSDDGLKTVSKTDADGNGTFERIVTDETVLDADGGTTRTVETRSQSGQLLSRTQIETSDNGLVTVKKTDRDGDGSYDVVETATTVLEADGGTVTTTESSEGGVLRARTTQTVTDNGRSSVTESDVNGDGETDVRTTQTVAIDGKVTNVTQSLAADGTLQSQSRTATSADGLSVTTSRDADGNGAYETRSESVRVLNADGSTTTTVSAKAQNGALESRVAETVSADGLTTTRAQDFDGDGKNDETSVRKAVIGADGTITTTETVKARNGDLLMSSMETVSGDGRSSTLAIDADGNGQYDRVTTVTVGDDGVTTTTASSYSATGDLLARTTSSESGNGLERTVSFDLDGNEAADRTLSDVTELAVDGSTTRTVTHETGSGRLLAREQVISSDDGLTVTTALDLDGQGGNDFVTTKTTAFAHDGSTSETWTTRGPGGLKGSATRETSGDGLEVTTEVDLDGDGDIDRSTSVTRNATGGTTETNKLFGNGTSLERSETTVVSADERRHTVNIDRDGDGDLDLSTHTAIDLSGDTLTTWSDLAANGDAEAVLTRQANANGTSDIYRLDIDGDGSTDITRETAISYDGAGNEIRVFEETEAVGGLAFRSTTVTSGNGLTSITETDSDGDGKIDTRAETKTVLNADGSSTTTSRDWYERSGVERSSYAETVSADRRTITEVFDFDGDNVTDKTRVTKTAADGSVVVVETGFGENGAQKRSVTTTSSDGLTTSVLRDGVTQTFSRSELGNGSYDWDNGVTATSSKAHITVSHKVDAAGVETWEMTSVKGSSTTTYSERFDAGSKARLLTEAARVYDAVLDRDMDTSEIEVLVQFADDSQLILEDLAAALLASGEYEDRYGEQTNAEFLARAYQNTLGREPTLEEWNAHLAKLDDGTGRATFIAELSESAEHVVVGNGHGESNNYDVFLLDVVQEGALERPFGVDELALVADDDKVYFGTSGANVFNSSGYDALIGRAGDDQLWGDSGNQLVVGGTGDDYLRAKGGNDTYVFNRGDGDDVIIDEGGSSDMLWFGKGIDIDDLKFSRSDDHLRIDFYGESSSKAAEAAAKGLGALTGSVTIRYWFSDSNMRIENLAFETGDGVWIGHLQNFQQGTDFSFVGRSTPVSASAINDNPDRSLIGDFNGDGREDVMVTWDSTGTNRLFLGRADGGFDQRSDTIAPTAINGSPDQALVGDFNGDGRDDLMFTWSDTGTNRVYLGQSGGGFSGYSNKIPTAAINGSPDKVSVGDYNGDGRDDLMFTWSATGTNRLYSGRSDGGFDGHSNLVPTNILDGNPDRILVGDYNGDGRDDMMVTWSSTGTNTYLRSRTGGDFKGLFNTIPVDSINGSPDDAVVGDFNGDGRDDLMFFWTATGTNRLFLGRSDSQFDTRVNAIDPQDINGGPSHILVGDFNGDGRDDLQMTWASSGQNRLYLGQSEGGFERKFDLIAREQINDNPNWALVLDVDGNGNDDLLSVWTGSGDNNVALSHTDGLNVINGSAANDLLNGLQGNDALDGLDGHDSLFGGEGDDVLRGGAGNDLMDAGTGTGANWQYLEGQEGDDFYLIGSDAGLVWLTDDAEWESSGTDTVRFKELTLADLTISSEKAGNEPILRFRWNEDGKAGELRLADTGAWIERIEFADGSVLSDIVFDAEGRLDLRGSPGDDLIVGGAGDDIIRTGNGNDILDAGAGTGSNWQHLMGRYGDDTYLIAADAGLVWMNDQAEFSDSGNDTVRFKDLKLSDLTIASEISGDEPILRFQWNVGGKAGELRLADKGAWIERFEFADGTSLSKMYTDGNGRSRLFGTAEDDYIRATSLSPGDGSGRLTDDPVVEGGAGNDVLDAGAGDFADNAFLRGQAGDDTYIINSRSGSIVIDAPAEDASGGTDTLRFTDLSLSDLSIQFEDQQNVNGVALFLSWSAEGDRPAGQVMLANEGQHFERFEFADGTTLSAIIAEGEGRLDLRGTDGNDLMIGGVGDDIIRSGNGNDVLDAGAGTGTNWQHLKGRYGDDTYLIGSDAGLVWMTSDAELADSGADTVRFKDLMLSDLTVSNYVDNGTSVLRFQWNKDGVTGELRLAEGGAEVERFEFADGTTLSEISLASDGSVILTGTSGNDTITGTSGTDTLTGGAGNDTFVFTALNSQIPQATPADIVTDFVAGAGTDDVLELSSSHFSGFDDVLARAVENVSDGSVTLNVGMDAPLVVLEGVALADLHQDDFRFV